MPCFATPAPAAAATSAAAVEMLNVALPSPPVPTMSTRSVALRRDGERRARASPRRSPAISSARLALQPQRDEEAADLGLRRLAGHDLVHHRARLLAVEVVTVEQPRERLLDHDSRKFRASSRPSGGQHGLGVELDAVDRQLAVADAHHLAVARSARVTSSSSGTRVAASEW